MTERTHTTGLAEPLGNKLSIEEMQEIVDHCEDTVSRIHRKDEQEEQGE